ncbi:MAG: hypothetical protein J1E61_03950 [Lachnospiraceae bacterium]|nr:hypothetical protein [Lachnospiraceae bacterium]
MKSTKKQKEWLLLPLCIFLFMALLTGCGKQENRNVEPEPEIETKAPADKDDVKTRKEETSDPDQDKSPRKLSEEELAALEHVERIEITDIVTGYTTYAYAPVGTEVYEEGFCLYDEHGLSYDAAVYNVEDIDELYACLDYHIDLDMEYGWEMDTEFETRIYENVHIGNVMENGDDRYVIATAENPDSQGSISQCRKIFYLELQSDSVAVIWSLEMSEWSTDEETDLIIDDMEKCYGIDLDPIRSTGSYYAEQEASFEQTQDEYVPREGHNVLAGIDGYQYLGLGTLAYYNGEADCPVMVPMGYDVWFDSDDYVTSSLHGVDVTATISIVGMQGFNTEIPREIRSKQDFYNGYEKAHHVITGETIPLTDFDAALYTIIECDMDYTDDLTLHRVLIFSYILIKEGYVLEYKVELYPEKFDDSTNTVLKELEDAYGFDLSDYYYKRKK